MTIPMSSTILKATSASIRRWSSTITKGIASTEKTRLRSPYHRLTAVAQSSSSSNNDVSSSNVAFDRGIKLQQRDGAARLCKSWREANKIKAADDDESIIEYDYFHGEIAIRVVDRLDDIVREEGFPLALDIGSGSGHIYKAICSDDGLNGVGGIGGIRKLVQIDSSADMLTRDEDVEDVEGKERCGTYKMVVDEEGRLPFPDGTFDLVISSCALHRVNDLPNLLKEAKRVLKPDGCIMLAMVGGSTLPELRSSLVLAEMEREGGVSTHVGPFCDFSDVGGLLTAAGFTLPTVDIDTVLIGYPNAMVLMEHLQRMGEGNASLNRRGRVSRDTFLSAACIYSEMFPLEGGEEEDVKASVQVIYAIGWTPHESQQKPDERGSATHKLTEIDIVDHHKS